MKRHFSIISIFLSISVFLYPSVVRSQIVTANAAAPRKPTSADMLEALKKLHVVGSVLYVAAHPDDENTRMITYFANARHLDVTYLSLTRGDGGQNLIGTEMRELLGVLRTQELLAARRVDGGQQLFSRANDFGFSKNPSETFEIWERTQVLADVVWAIRKTRPDIMINRFSTDTTIDTHGHHTASAILGAEAFDVAAQKTAFPEQFTYGVSTWQPRRIFCNQSWFFYGSPDSFQRVMDRGGERFLKMDIGAYYPAKGKSNDEIAAESRSMHRCQAMGTSGSRGETIEYLEWLKGDLKPKNDPFDGINTSWTRLKGGEKIDELLKKIIENFKYDNPSASVKDLLTVRKLIENIEDEFWKKKKLRDLDELIQWCCGIFAEATVKDATLTLGAKTDVNIEIINRSSASMTLKKVGIFSHNNIHTNSILPNVFQDTSLNTLLKNNLRKQLTIKFEVPKNATPTAPYWLMSPPSVGMYEVSEQLLRGLPETPRNLHAVFSLEIEGHEINLFVPVVNKFANPAKGEIYRPLEVTPSVFVNFSEKVFVFADEKPKTVTLTVKSAKAGEKGSLTLQLPNDWRIEPSVQNFELQQKGEEKTVTFQIFPPKNAAETTLRAVATLQNGAKIDKSAKIIEYDHIPTQTILSPAEAKAVKLDLKKYGSKVGYLMGAGDEMPTFIEQMGYVVTLLDEKHFDTEGVESLSKFDAIVIGIRAYNTKEKLKFWNKKLFEYVEKGGTLIVQYNTNGRDLVMPDLAPFPMKLSRERVTEENAKMRILKPQHIALTAPNKINTYDFQGWVQERGLYFPSSWDKNFEALLSCNDAGEKPLDGSLLVARHGKGYYVYTGLSFFRQLPAGVGGAYRLFANLLSLGNLKP